MTMSASSESFTLNCLVLGNNPPSAFVFTVNIPRNETVSDLQATIKSQSKPTLDDDEDLLDLRSLSVVIDDDFDSKMADFSTSIFASITSRKLQRNQEIDNIFPKPVPGHLHIVVQRPDDESRRLKRRRSQSVPPELPSNIAPRNVTVSILYEKLFPVYTYGSHFLQVRGTPRSGKTMLALLLGRYIKQLRPKVPVIWVDGWRGRETRSWSSYLRSKGWKSDDETVFIFDEAQETYWDTNLWNVFFKSIHDYPCTAIVFASYGSPTSTGVENTNMVINQRVTLSPIDDVDGLPPIGVLLTRLEFQDLIAGRYPSEQHSFHATFLDGIFSLTAGHAGAVSDLLDVILASDKWYRLVFAAHYYYYTWKVFAEIVDPRQLLGELGHTVTFRSGSPSIEDLEAPAFARVFSAVLRTGFAKEADFHDESTQDALQQCFRKGWLHADRLDDVGIRYETGYLFPSSLHQWIVEWNLWETHPDTTFDAKDILTFAVEVISCYCPENLTKNRRVGPGCVLRPSEARYQDEFYRCGQGRSNGSLLTFPEFAIGNGCADLYIPAKNWGLEILRNGEKIEQHSGRFSRPELYAGNFPVDDYIILDFTDSYPAVAQSDHQNLYHVVFSDHFHTVSMLNKNLELIPGGEFALSPA